MKGERAYENLQAKQPSETADPWLPGEKTNEGRQSDTCIKAEKREKKGERVNTIQRKGKISITRRREIEALINSPGVMLAEFVGVKSRRSSDGLRLLIQVPKRVGGAVRRNRARRVIREWFRQNSARLPARHFLVFVRKELNISRRETGRKIRDELEKLLLG